MIVECPNCKHKVSDISTEKCPVCDFDIKSWAIEEEYKRKQEEKAKKTASVSKFDIMMYGGGGSYQETYEEEQRQKQIRAEKREQKEIQKKENQEKRSRALQTFLLFDIAWQTRKGNRLKRRLFDLFH